MSKIEVPPRPFDAVSGVITDRTLAALRLLLSVSAVVILYIDPVEPSRLSALTYSAVLLYVIYAFAIYLRTRITGGFSWEVFRALTWVDVLLFSFFITLNN